MVSIIGNLNIMHRIVSEENIMSTWRKEYYYAYDVVHMFILVDDVAALYDMIILIIGWSMICNSRTVIITQPIIISCSGILPRRTIISIL